MSNENTNVQSFDVTKENFFRMWLLILQPFLKLRNKELDALAKMLYHRYLISLEVRNKEMIDDLLFSKKVKDKIIEELDIKDYSFDMIITALRKKKIIIGKTINKQVIPTINEPFTNFKLIYNINVK